MRRRKPVILLSIETKVREFPGKVLLGSYLAKAGFRVVFTNNRSIKQAANISAWMYIDRNTFKGRKNFFRSLKKIGVKIACIDEEGIVWYKPEDYMKRLNPKSIKYVDIFCSWGAEQTKLIKKSNNKIKVAETGNPRVDLLRPELNDIYKSEANRIYNKYGEFVLYVSNFGGPNHFHNNVSHSDNLKERIKFKRKHGFLFSKNDEEELKERYYHKLETFKRVKSAIIRLAEKSPDINIIVRPHPSENFEVWKNAVKNYENIQIIFEGTLEPWLLAANKVVHNSCTSAIEAIILKKKTIAYVPLDNKKHEAFLPNSLSIVAKDYDELVNLIKTSFDNLPIRQNGLIKNYITALEGDFASKRITDEIRDLYESDNQKWKNILRIVKQKKVSTILNFKLMIKNILGYKISNRQDEYKKQKFPGITLDEVNNTINTYQSYTDELDDIIAIEKSGLIEILQK